MTVIVDIFTPEDVHQYVDGNLDAPTRASFEALLDDDPKPAAEVAAYQRQNALLCRAFACGVIRTEEI